MTTTNLPDGVTNAALNSTLQSYVAMDPSTVHQYVNDFDTYLASDWTLGNVGSGTLALTSGDGGLLLVTNGAADDDHVYAQLVAPGFTTEDRKDLWFKARFKVSDATQSDVLMGLYLLDTSPIASAPADGIYFSKLDGAATFNFLQSKTSGSTSTLAGGTLVADTFITIGFHYNGYGTTHFYVDDVRVGSLDNTNLPTVPLSVSWVIQNGEAVAKTMTIDYIIAAKRRTVRQS